MRRSNIAIFFFRFHSNCFCFFSYFILHFSLDCPQQIVVELRKIRSLIREMGKIKRIHIETKNSFKRSCFDCCGRAKAFYLSLTKLSEYGLRGRLFIMSDSACSYAREIAGT